MAFPHDGVKFQVGNPGGPGRPRKHPPREPKPTRPPGRPRTRRVLTKGRPWAEFQRPWADLEALAATWAAMVSEGQMKALVPLLALLSRRGLGDELGDRMLREVTGRIRLEPLEVDRSLLAFDPARVAAGAAPSDPIPSVPIPSDPIPSGALHAPDPRHARTPDPAAGVDHLPGHRDRG
jgi:hypothetical protein